MLRDERLLGFGHRDLLPEPWVSVNMDFSGGPSSDYMMFKKY